MFKTWDIFEKIDGFFEKNLNFFKIAKCGKFAVEGVSNGIFSRNYLFRPIKVFLAKNQKNSNVEKIEKYYEERVFFFREKNDSIF